MSSPPDLTRPGAPPAPGEPVPRLVVTAVVAVVGFVLLLVGSGWVGFVKAGLATVLTTQLDVVSDTTAPGGSWGPLVACTAVGAALVTGPRVRVGRVDALQLGAATWTIACLVGFTWLGSGWEFTGPESHCVYRSCWPHGYQEAALAAPLVVTCALMLVMATWGRLRARWFRALVPAVAFAVLSVVQVAVWERLVVPIFNAPPPF